MKCIISGFYPAITCDKVTEGEAKFEYVMLGLRTRYGFSTKAYKKQFGTNVGDDFPNAFKKSLQYLELDGDVVRIKDEYLYVQNSVLMPFLDEVPVEEEEAE